MFIVEDSGMLWEESFPTLEQAKERVLYWLNDGRDPEDFVIFECKEVSNPITKIEWSDENND